MNKNSNKNNNSNKDNNKNSKNLYELKRQGDRRDRERLVKSQEKALENQRIRNELGQKKSFFSLPQDVVGIIFAVFVSFVGTYFYLPWHGTISAIPIVVVCAFLCAFVKISELMKLGLFFVSPFAVSLMLGEGVGKAFVFGAFCSVFYLLATASVMLYKKGKANFRAVSALMLLLSLGLHVFANSTPWGVSQSNKAVMDYVTGNYSGEPLLASDVKFNSFDRTYTVSLTPMRDAEYSLDVVFKDGKIIEDQYIDYAEKYNMIVGAGQITYVIRKMFPDMKFSVEGDRINGYPFSTSASVVPKADYSKYTDYSVYFPSYNDAKEFSELAEKCYRELLMSGFFCRTITFYGGIGTRYVAKISIPFNALVNELENFVEPCDNDIFLYTSLK